MAWKTVKKSYLPVGFIGLLCLAMVVIGTKVPETTIQQLVARSGPYGVVVLIILFWLTHVVAPLSGSPFLFAGFYLYGQKVVGYAFAAFVLSAITNFWIARLWGRTVVQKLAGKRTLAKLDSFSQNYGWQTLLVFRLFLKDIHDVVSYAFGLTTLSFKTYFLLSVFGTVPLTVVQYYLAVRIRNPWIFMVLVWGFAYSTMLVYLTWIFIRKTKRKKSRIS